MILYHATTPKKVHRYKSTRAILSPVRGFDTFDAAKYWAERHNRCIVLRFETDDTKTHKLPDHHNIHGRAYWAEQNIEKWDIEWTKKGVVSDV